MLNLTNTRCAAYVSGIANFAKASERAHSVNTLSISA